MSESVFEPVYLFGKLCMYSEFHSGAKEVEECMNPKKMDMHVYSLRHGDDDYNPVELAHYVRVNYGGFVICDEEIPRKLLTENYLNIEEDDFDHYPNNIDELPKTFDEYLEYPHKGEWAIPFKRFTPIPKKEHRLFISQPFTGMNDDDIRKQRRELAWLYLQYKNIAPYQMELINQHEPDDPYDIDTNFKTEAERDAYRFCRSIGMMKDATEIIFYGDWTKSRGCKIEREIALKYGMNIIEQEHLIDFCKTDTKHDDSYMILWKEEYFKDHEVIVPKGLGEAYDEDKDPKDAEKDE